MPGQQRFEFFSRLHCVASLLSGSGCGRILRRGVLAPIVVCSELFRSAGIPTHFALTRSPSTVFPSTATFPGLLPTSDFISKLGKLDKLGRTSTPNSFERTNQRTNGANLAANRTISKVTLRLSGSQRMLRRHCKFCNCFVTVASFRSEALPG